MTPLVLTAATLTAPVPSQVFLLKSPDIHHIFLIVRFINHLHVPFYCGVAVIAVHAMDLINFVVGARQGLQCCGLLCAVTLVIHVINGL